MIIDCHVHYITGDYVEHLDHYVSCSESSTYIREVILPRIEGIDGNRGLFEHYLREARRLGVNRSIIFGLADTAAGCRDINDEVAAVVAESPEQLLGFGSVPLSTAEEVGPEMHRIRYELGFGGVKIYPSMSRMRLNSEPVLEVLTQAAELDLVVLTDCSFVCWDSPHFFGEGNKFYHLLEALGQLQRRPRVLAAHLGGGLAFCRDLYEWSHGGNLFDTIWFDISPFFPVSMIRAALEVVSADRLLFGSDFPFSTGEENVKALSQAAIASEDREMILAGSAQRLLGL